MSRAQGHIANVLCVLFDHVIETQRQQRMGEDQEMEAGKQTSSFLFYHLLLSQSQNRHVSASTLASNSHCILSFLGQYDHLEMLKLRMQAWISAFLNLRKADTSSPKK